MLPTRGRDYFSLQKIPENSPLGERRRRCTSCVGVVSEARRQEGFSVAVSCCALSIPPKTSGKKGRTKRVGAADRLGFCLVVRCRKPLRCFPHAQLFVSFVFFFSWFTPPPSLVKSPDKANMQAWSYFPEGAHTTHTQYPNIPRHDQVYPGSTLRDGIADRC